MKRCPRCGESKQHDDFPSRKNRTDGLGVYCRPCQRAYDREWWAKGNRSEKTRPVKTARLRHHKQLVWDYLANHSCVDCGETDPIVLQFDHLHDKRDDVGSMVRQGMAWDTIEAEIAKCAIRCANCHTRKTANDFGWFIGT